MSKEKLFSKLTRSRKLKFDDEIKIKSENFKQFIDRELFDLFYGFDTYYTKSLNRQCKKGAYRSIGDIYSVVKFYFPDTTPQEFVKYFFNRDGGVRGTDDLNKKYDIIGHYCNEVRKRVYSSKRIRGGGIYYDRRRDENGLFLNEYLTIARHEEETSNIE